MGSNRNSSTELFSRSSSGRRITGQPTFVRTALGPVAPILPLSALWAAIGDEGLPPVERHIASLMPRRMSQTLAGQAVAKPIIMPICISNQ